LYIKIRPIDIGSHLSELFDGVTGAGSSKLRLLYYNSGLQAATCRSKIPGFVVSLSF